MAVISSLGILAILFLLCRRPGNAAENINTGRQFEIDLAKVISLAWMILVHVDEEFYEEGAFAPGVETWFNVFIEFTGGPLAAPVFMAAMGVGLAYSRSQAPGGNALRGLKLIGNGYILNILRGFLPCLVFFWLYNSKELFHTGIEELLCLDILHFAGLVFLFFALMKWLNAKDIWFALAAFVLLIAGSLALPFYPQKELCSVWPGYFLYQNPLTPFPFCVWLIYPVIGYLFGKVLQQVADKTRFYARLLAGGALLFALSTGLLLLSGYDLFTLFANDSTYAQNSVKVFWILGIIAVWCSLLYFISPLLANREPIKKLVAFLSKQINTVFFIQWILIGWLKFGGALQSPVVYGGKFFLFLGLIAVLTVLLTYAADYVKTRYKDRKQSRP